MKKLAYLFSVISLLCTSSWAQEGIIENFILGKKVSPYKRGLDASGKLLAASVFGRVGYGYESNIYDAPNYFVSTGVTQSKQFVTAIALPQSATPFLGTVGVELASNKCNKHSFRLILARQTNKFLNHDKADLKDFVKFTFLKKADSSYTFPNAYVRSFDGYLHYRFDISEKQRLDWQTQIDRVYGTGVYFNAIPTNMNNNDFLHVESSLEYHLQTIDPPFLGRGITQLMLNARYRDYNNVKDSIMFTRVPNGTEIQTYISSDNDTIDADYFQYRVRLRHVQGLLKGYSVRLSGDYIKREYMDAWAKRIGYKDSVTSIDMGSIPKDSLGNPLADHPHRSQHEVRAYAGVQYDPPHVNNLRFSAGCERLWLIDPYEGFYNYKQFAVMLSGVYRPTSLKYIEAIFRVKHRDYTELKTNYHYIFTNPQSFTYPGMHDGELVTVADSTWKEERLKTDVLEFSLNTQLPLTKCVALWGLYNIDSRVSNRPVNEIFSREYFNQSIAGGITIYLELLGNSENVLFKRDKR